MKDPNRLSWPPTRSDLAAAVSIGVLIYCLVAQVWPGVAALALAGTIFAAVSPRMKGPFGFSGGGTRFGGAFTDPFAEQVEEVVSSQRVQAGASPADPSLRQTRQTSSREPGSD